MAVGLGMKLRFYCTLCRNSKLTMLLQDSLGGDAKALMFCNIAPVALHAGDTFSSLNFASKVRTPCVCVWRNGPGTACQHAGVCCGGFALAHQHSLHAAHCRAEYL
jgi:Kinesin motor domain